jgi:hypothetical protein
MSSSNKRTAEDAEITGHRWVSSGVFDVVVYAAIVIDRLLLDSFCVCVYWLRRDKLQKSETLARGTPAAATPAGPGR